MRFKKRLHRSYVHCPWSNDLGLSHRRTGDPNLRLAPTQRLASQQGMAVVRVSEAADLSARAGVRWTNVAMRLPDDGTGALPLLRHVILDQSKSATYKLGLLRAV